jgi:SET domain-containing protein
MIIPGKMNFNLKVGKSQIHGKGAYAINSIPARKKIGSMSGVIISRKEGRLKAKTKSSISLVELWNGKSLDASQYSNELKFINHSCKPNTFMRTIGYHVEFYALRTINSGEELSCNYGETHHDGKKKCTCGAEGCKGFI